MPRSREGSGRKVPRGTWRRIVAFAAPYRGSLTVFLLIVIALVAVAPAVFDSVVDTPATRALLEGRYDDVDQLTGQIGANDPAAVAVKARALIARGRYAEAETALKPVAGRAPSSVAALELGLLGKLLGRPDANAILNRVAAESRDLLVAARALRAIGQFKEANGIFLDLVARYELSLESSRQPELRAAIDEGGRQLRAMLAQLLESLGVPDPDQAAWPVAAMLDGLLYDRVAGTGATLSPEAFEAAVRRSVAALIAVLRSDR